MCFVTLAIWLVLFVVAATVGMASGSDSLTVGVGLSAIVLALALPLAVSYWRPLFAGWGKRRKKMQEKLQADGVLTPEDMDKGARAIRLWEAISGTEKKRRGSQQDGFLLLDGKMLRVLGENTCITTEAFTVTPSCTGRCSRCAVLALCGGDTFHLKATVGGVETEYLLRSREGRNLRAVARATEMLEELVEININDSGKDKHSPKEAPAAT